MSRAKKGSPRAHARHVTVAVPRTVTALRWSVLKRLCNTPTATAGIKNAIFVVCGFSGSMRLLANTVCRIPAS